MTGFQDLELHYLLRQQLRQAANMDYFQAKLFYLRHLKFRRTSPKALRLWILLRFQEHKDSPGRRRLSK